MQTIKIFRKYHEYVTLGRVECTNSTGKGFACKSIELPFHDNKKNISCIPEDRYLCLWTRSPKFSKQAGRSIFTYEVQDVPNRSGIRIHTANYVRELRGCIAFGVSFADIDKDGIIDIVQSSMTIGFLHGFMGFEPIELLISGYDTI